MTEPESPLEADQVRAIAMISDKLQLPIGEVGEIYRKEFERLAVQARIPTFLVVLAMRNARSILSGLGKRTTLR
jgi:hypothetical protein